MRESALPGLAGGRSKSPSPGGQPRLTFQGPPSVGLKAPSIQWQKQFSRPALNKWNQQLTDRPVTCQLVARSLCSWEPKRSFCPADAGSQDKAEILVRS